MSMDEALSLLQNINETTQNGSNLSPSAPQKDFGRRIENLEIKLTEMGEMQHTLESQVLDLKTQNQQLTTIIVNILKIVQSKGGVPPSAPAPLASGTSIPSSLPASPSFSSSLVSSSPLASSSSLVSSSPSFSSTSSIVPQIFTTSVMIGEDRTSLTRDVKTLNRKTLSEMSQNKDLPGAMISYVNHLKNHENLRSNLKTLEDCKNFYLEKKGEIEQIPGVLGYDWIAAKFIMTIYHHVKDAVKQEIDTLVEKSDEIQKKKKKENKGKDQEKEKGKAAEGEKEENEGSCTDVEEENFQKRKREKKTIGIKAFPP